MKNTLKHIMSYLVVMTSVISVAQTTTENYVVNKTYKVESQNPLITEDPDSIAKGIQYYDGLGRLKQSVIVKGGTNALYRNYLDYDWTLGNSGSTPFYTAEGISSENTIVNGTTPFGDTDLLWECKGVQDNGGSQGDGGWITAPISIDKTQTYRYTVWVKRTGSQDGVTYFGVTDIDNLDGTTNTNAYFWTGDLPQLDTWYLMVGIVHPNSHSTADSGIAGIYDTQGNKVLDATEFKWRSTTSTGRFRNYLFYATNPVVRQYFWSPLVQKIDGSEMSVVDIATSSSFVFENQIDAKDIVTHVEYDGFGRQAKEYLPYVSANTDGRFDSNAKYDTQVYYLNKYSADFPNITDPAEVNAFSEKFFDNSSLSRVIEQTAPGSAWKQGSTSVTGKMYSTGNTIRMEHETNASSDQIRIYTVSTTFSNNTYSPSLQGGTSFYSVGELVKLVTKDENWKEADGLLRTTEEYKNKSGQVILKRTYAEVGSPSAVEEHDTYYVYDDFGNLTYVFSPKVDTSDGISATELSELSYQYVYDHRNRLVEKKIPGKGWENIVYDKLDRPILTQDAVQRLTNDWSYTKYDQLGRVAYTGIWDNPNSFSRTEIQNDKISANNWYETRVSVANNVNGVDIYYTSNDLPDSDVEILTVSYYDTYIDLPSGFMAPASVYGQLVTTNTHGLSTVAKTRVLGTSDWITTVTYYDEKARPIHVYSQNDYLETIDMVESKLDFVGKVLETKTIHQRTGQIDVSTIDTFEYDHMDRLIGQSQKVNNQISERIVKNNYSHLGQLESKLTGNGTQSGYTNVVGGVLVTEDNIRKTGTTNSWDAGLITSGSFDENGYVECEMSLANKDMMIGLATNNSNVSYTNINYALHPTGSGNLMIYESGTSKGVFGTYQAGDVFRVERIGSEVYYKKNDVIIYISPTPSSGSLFGDISLYTPNTNIKNLHVVDNSKGLQNVDYAYNVRGWLRNINEDTQSDNDLFNFTLRYNDPTTGTALFNGNISQTSWNTASTNTTGNPVSTLYTYSYDALNRIMSAIDNTGNYNLTGVGYDKNGNILTLQRKGSDGTNVITGFMDDLSYTYTSNSNQLKKVLDAGDASFGFKDGANTTTEYTYDANGNMISDANKAILGISYNHLNLPITVFWNTSRRIDYVYDASGTKLEKKVNNSGNITTTEYAGSHIYEKVNSGSSELQFFSNVEGYSKYDAGFATILLEDKFESGTDGWVANGANASVQQDNGRLKVNVSGQYTGTQKYMNVAVGDRIEYNIKIDQGTTDKLDLLLIEHDANNGQLSLMVPTYEEDGYYRGTYVVSNSNVAQLRVKVEKSPGTDNGSATHFFIDDVTFAKVTHTGGLFSDVFQYKDHLGNIRLSYSDADDNGTIDTSTEIIEESNYYPFGLKHKGYNNVILSTNIGQNFKYNGKELDEDLGLNLYHYGFRLYDPILARFPSIDPASDKFPHVSTYNYAENEPIASIDLWGLQQWRVNGRERTTAYSSTKKDAEMFKVYISGKGVGAKVIYHGKVASEIAFLGTGEIFTNPLQHALGAALLTNEFGSSTAKQILDAREGMDATTSSLSFVDESEEFNSSLGAGVADTTVDLLNNNIGINLGLEMDSDATAIDFAKELLKIYKEEGLWNYKSENDEQIIFKQFIDDDQYDLMLEKLAKIEKYFKQNKENHEDKKDE